MQPASADFLSRLQQALAAAGDVAYEWHIPQDNVAWLGDAGQLFDLSQAAIPNSGEALNLRIHPDDLALRLKLLKDHFAGLAGYDVEYRVRLGNGQFSWVHDRGRVEISPDGEPVFMRGALRVVDDRKDIQAQLEYRANFDELTGHYNRGRLRDLLREVMAQTTRYSNPGAYFAIGIDKMSLINEAYGYDAADAVLVAVGQRIEELLRASDRIGRTGGDAYGVVLPRCREQDMPLVADKILRAFREQPVRTQFGRIHITVSIGGASYPETVQTAHDAMTKAENALQQAKLRGRDCYVQYRASEEQQVEHRINMEIGNRVVESIKSNELVFAFQPVVKANSGEIAFYEALLRMKNSDGSIMPANLFVPAVEQVGLTRLIDRRVMELVIAELEQYPNISISMNISGLTVSERSWLRRLVTLLKERRDVAQRLIIEITETAALQDIEESALFVRTVRDLGCKVALDDFGAGYTSFRHLKALTVDIVKIDGAFVRNLLASHDNQLFVRTLLELANCFGLQTLAECVETNEIADKLRDEGVHYLQGWLYGKPSIQRSWAGES